MKLNPDCVRDILLSIEEATSMEADFEYEEGREPAERLKKYEPSEVIYHFRQCKLSDYLYNPVMDNFGGCFASDLTPSGHEFLADIRSNSVWSKTKETSEKVGADSIRAIKDIAVKVVAGLIKETLGA